MLEFSHRELSGSALSVADLPVLGICGWSGSGKTTLIEALVRDLRAAGLRIAVVKHDAHGVCVDRPGKDSDRFFRAGADVLLQGPDQQFLRIHPREQDDLLPALRALSAHYDFILVEGHKASPIPKLWLEHPEKRGAVPAHSGVLAVLSPGEGRIDRARALIRERLETEWRRTPVFGCLLTRKRQQVGFLTAVIERFSEVTERLVIVGSARGVVPGALSLPPLPDVPGSLGGLLAAMRWVPSVSWLAMSADAPVASADVLREMRDARRPGVWGITAAGQGTANWPRFPACLDFRCRPILEAMAMRGVTDLAQLPAWLPGRVLSVRAAERIGDPQPGWP